MINILYLHNNNEYNLNKKDKIIIKIKALQKL